MRANIPLARDLCIKFSKISKKFDAIFTPDENKIEKKLPQPIFVMGVPRSGTTLVYQILAQEFRLSYITAPVGYSCGLSSIVSKLIKMHIKRPAIDFKSEYGAIKGLFSPSEHPHFWYQWFEQDNHCGHYYSPGNLCDSDAVEMRSKVAAMSQIYSAPLVVKNVYLDLAIEVLARVFVDSRFVIVNRDPVSVVMSIMRARQSTARNQSWWSVKPPGYRAWLKLPLWEQCTLQFFYTSKIMELQLNSINDNRYFKVDYAEICNQPGATVERIAEWLKPHGYERYTDSNLPKSFKQSSGNQNEDVEDKIRALLRELEQKYSGISSIMQGKEAAECGKQHDLNG